MTIATGTEGPFWATLQGSWTTEGSAEMSFGLLSFGGHLVQDDDLVIGIMGQIDSARSEDGDATLSGTGALVGPYAAARLGGLIVDGRLLWGRSENEISPLGTYTDSFSTERFLATLALSGEMAVGEATLIPVLDYGYLEERQESYVDSNSNPVAAQTIRLGELSAGLDWRVPLDADGATQLTGGLSGTRTLEGAADPRGRLDLGLRHAAGNGVNIDIGGFYDGIGADRETRGLSLHIDWAF